MVNLLLYSAAVLIWGGTWLVIKFQLTQVSPVLSVAYRFGLAAAILFIFCLSTRRNLRFPARQQGFLALYGGLIFCCGYVLCYQASIYITSGLLAIVFSLIQAMNILNLRLFLGRAVRPRAVIGGLVGLVGLCLAFRNEILSFSLTAGVKGLLLGIVAAYFASLGNVAAVKNDANGVPVAQANAFGMAYGAVFTLGLHFLLGGRLEIDVSIGYLGPLLYLAVFGSVIAFGCYFSLVNRIGADYAAYCATLSPILAMMLSWRFEGYVWTLPALIGIVAVLAGNVIVLTPGRVIRSHLKKAF
ncbi:DMT family transporter [Desulfosarcina sp.]|uniref:DMT family transporter n=1 Tax=Desulfosarcina sp. TaxID=2027861 RepID=UPI0029AB9C51|nr:DMT family transporter [Desulfosarcina sp.]MDX2455208.1 DMT family transporter [Desulfosarcina sp.]